MKKICIFIMIVFCCAPAATSDQWLTSGWNLVSINTVTDDISVEAVLESIADQVEAVWAYDGQWDFYSDVYPEFIDLYELVPGKGYWIKLNSDALLVTQGLVDNSPVLLMSGWNLAGFNNSQTKTPEQAFSAVKESILSVWAYEDNDWLVYDPINPAISTLTVIKPGQGYWIKTIEPCTWIQ